jgi:hypothetical protein
MNVYALQHVHDCLTSPQYALRTCSVTQRAVNEALSLADRVGNGGLSLLGTSHAGRVAPSVRLAFLFNHPPLHPLCIFAPSTHTLSLRSTAFILSSVTTVCSFLASTLSNCFTASFDRTQVQVSSIALEYPILDTRKQYRQQVSHIVDDASNV